MNNLKKIVKNLFLKIFNIDLIKRPFNDIDYRHQRIILGLSFLKLPVFNEEQKNELDFIKFCQKNEPNSFSQNFQDLFVLYVLKEKKNGFFVEFGATDGIELSNTLILEKEYNWRGILAEPAKSFHPFLFSNRNVIIETNCVWKHSNEIVKFQEFAGTGLSGITKNIFTNSNRSTYDVETISLFDLLLKHNAPSIIDFLSIDTEGSEFEILNSFNFKKYEIKIIIVEHNYKKIRKDIYNLLTLNGYKRVFTNLSFQDDWYILN